MFKIAFCVIVLVYLWDPFAVFACNETDITESRSNVSHGDGKSWYRDALRCGGWGKRITSAEQYERMKDKCYLTIREKHLCCIDLPYCPNGMVAEIPLKPYFMYLIYKLKIGCKSGTSDEEKMDDLFGTGKPEEGHKKLNVQITICYASEKKKRCFM